MKKFLLVLSLSFAVVLTTAANPAPVDNPRAEKAFQKMFADASHVTWSEVKGGLFRVSFVWGGHQSVAFFDKDAHLIGTVRGLFFNELPLSVTKSVTENFSGATILEVNEIFNEEGIQYRVVMEYKNKKNDVRLNGTGDVLDRKTEKK
jgi:hypothetical protein